MNLILVRHAKTEQESKDGSDFSRELKKRGVNQCATLNTFLKSLVLDRVKVLCSSSTRTVKTYELAVENLAIDKCLFTKNLYLPFMKDILKEINVQNHQGDLIVIGHNYSLSELLFYLTGENITMKTGSLALIEFSCLNSSQISGDTGRLLQYFEAD